MTEEIDGEDERAKLEKAIRKPIRPEVNRPQPLAVTDRETVERANAQMADLHEKAIAAARAEKLKLLLRRYSLADDDWKGLALALAIDHEPGFQRVDRQIVELPVGFSEPAFWGPVLVKDGQLIDKTSGRPVQWSGERLCHLLEAVQREKKKTGLTKDLDVLKCLARQNEWAPPNHRSNSTRGEFDAWVRTLQSRLHDAKQFQRRVDEANAELEEIQRRLIGE